MLDHDDCWGRRPDRRDWWPQQGSWRQDCLPCWEQPWEPYPNRRSPPRGFRGMGPPFQDTGCFPQPRPDCDYYAWERRSPGRSFRGSGPFHRSASHFDKRPYRRPRSPPYLRSSPPPRRGRERAGGRDRSRDRDRSREARERETGRGRGSPARKEDGNSGPESSGRRDGETRKNTEAPVEQLDVNSSGPCGHANSMATGTAGTASGDSMATGTAGTASGDSVATGGSETVRVKVEPVLELISQGWNEEAQNGEQTETPRADEEKQSPRHTSGDVSDDFREERQNEPGDEHSRCREVPSEQNRPQSTTVKPPNKTTSTSKETTRKISPSAAGDSEISNKVASRQSTDDDRQSDPSDSDGELYIQEEGGGWRLVLAEASTKCFACKKRFQTRDQLIKHLDSHGISSASDASQTSVIGDYSDTNTELADTVVRKTEDSGNSAPQTSKSSTVEREEFKNSNPQMKVIDETRETDDRQKNGEIADLNKNGETADRRETTTHDSSRSTHSDGSEPVFNMTALAALLNTGFKGMRTKSGEKSSGSVQNSIKTSSTSDGKTVNGAGGQSDKAKSNDSRSKRKMDTDDKETSMLDVSEESRCEPELSCKKPRNEPPNGKKKETSSLRAASDARFREESRIRNGSQRRDESCITDGSQQREESCITNGSKQREEHERNSLSATVKDKNVRGEPGPVLKKKKSDKETDAGNTTRETLSRQSNSSASEQKATDPKGKAVTTESRNSSDATSAKEIRGHESNSKPKSRAPTAKRNSEDTKEAREEEPPAKKTKDAGSAARKTPSLQSDASTSKQKTTDLKGKAMKTVARKPDAVSSKEARDHESHSNTLCHTTPSAQLRGERCVAKRVKQKSKEPTAKRNSTDTKKRGSGVKKSRSPPSEVSENANKEVHRQKTMNEAKEQKSKALTTKRNSTDTKEPGSGVKNSHSPTSEVSENANKEVHRPKTVNGAEEQKSKALTTKRNSTDTKEPGSGVKKSQSPPPQVSENANKEVHRQKPMNEAKEQKSKALTIKRNSTDTKGSGSGFKKSHSPTSEVLKNANKEVHRQKPMNEAEEQKLKALPTKRNSTDTKEPGSGVIKSHSPSTAAVTENANIEVYHQEPANGVDRAKLGPACKKDKPGPAFIKKKYDTDVSENTCSTSQPVTVQKQPEQKPKRQLYRCDICRTMFFTKEYAYVEHVSKHRSRKATQDMDEEEDEEDT